MTFDPNPFRAALVGGLFPVSFGDVVPDEAWGWSILSADTIAVTLARALGARRVLFVERRPGILARENRGPRGSDPRGDGRRDRGPAPRRVAGRT